MIFDDSLQRLSSMEQLSREEGNHSKHQKSKTIAVIERVSGNCGVACYVN